MIHRPQSSPVHARQSTERALARQLLCLLLLGFAPTIGLAQDFYHGGVSARTVAQAGIYTPAAGNALDAIVLNPAGLSALTAPEGDLLFTAGLTRGRFFNSENSDSGMRLRPGFLPFGALGTPLRWRRWSAGLGLTPDFLSSVYWHYADSPGTAGADYGLQSERSQITAYRSSVAIAFAPNDRLALGASAGLVYNENALIAPFIFQSNPSLKGLKTLLALHTRGFGWGGAVGLAARPARRLSLGAAYAAPITINGRGHASGNMGAQFRALGIPFQPDYTYSARVRVQLPQALLVNGRFQATPSLGISLQGDFANYRRAFRSLPVRLRNGNNADINNFLHSDAIDDEVPLNWSNQYSARAAIDRTVGEHYQLSGGYTRRSSLVPNGTLTPLTGAIMKNAFSAGAEYRRDRLQLAAAYVINLNQSATVLTSGLLAGEYSHSHLTVGSQALTAGLSFRLR